MSKVQAGGPLYLSIVHTTDYIRTFLRRKFWKKDSALSSNPFPPRSSICFFKEIKIDHTPYRRLHSPVAGAHFENFLIPSESSSGDSGLPNLDAILCILGQAFRK